VYSAEDARFAVEAVSSGGIPIFEIAMTVPGAIQVVSDRAKNYPELIVFEMIYFFLGQALH
jgi:2-keto-3-deoxy-6-phosphogluconate aldolase